MSLTVLPAKGPGRVVDEAALQRVYREVQTPYKYGTLLQPEEGEALDCPNVFRFRSRWYMLYVGLKDKVASDLLTPSEPWDNIFAHKPWLLKHDGVVYHFYCAVSKQERAIALATSKDKQPSQKAPGEDG